MNTTPGLSMANPSPGTAQALPGAIRNPGSGLSGPTVRPPDAIGHAACGKWWTGARSAHCGAAGCHRTFSSTTTFDMHQRTKPGGGVECLDPASVGLVASLKPWGELWGKPDDGYWQTRRRPS